METLFPEIDRELAKRNMHCRDLAKVVGIGEGRMHDLLHGRKSWRANEALCVCDYFDHPDIKLLFSRR